MDTNTLNRLCERLGRDRVLVCDECGSLEIQETAWVDPNYLTYAGTHENGRDDADNHWCRECEDHVSFCSLDEFEKRMDEDVKARNGGTPPKDWQTLSYIAKRKIWLNP